jgi:hypothetical protein
LVRACGQNYYRVSHQRNNLRFSQNHRDPYYCFCHFPRVMACRRSESHIVMMTNGPAASVGEVLAVDLERPRKRLDLAHDERYYHFRSEVIHFLHAREVA